MPHTPAVFYSAPTKLVRGDDMAMCIYRFPVVIPDSIKHVMPDQTYNCPHNSSITPQRRYVFHHNQAHRLTLSRWAGFNRASIAISRGRSK